MIVRSYGLGIVMNKVLNGTFKGQIFRSAPSGMRCSLPFYLECERFNLCLVILT